MAGVIKVLAALTMFTGIQFLTAKNMGLYAALAANLPFFTLYAYTVSSEPKNTALYLACFTAVISVSFFAVYFLPSKDKTVGVIVLLGVWAVLSSAVFLCYFDKWR